MTAGMTQTMLPPPEHTKLPPSPRRNSIYDPVFRWTASILIALIAVIVLLPALVTTSPLTLNAGVPLSPPSFDHLFGTDQLGRDVAARVLQGTRLSILIASSSAAVSLFFGALLGTIAAVGPRWLSEIVMRLIDIWLAFPGILFAIVLAAAIGPNVTTTIIVLGLVFAAPMARVFRGAVFAEYGHDYVTAARLSGTRRPRLVLFHVGINAAMPVLVYVTLIAAEAIIAEAALSFIGAGIRPPTPSLGNIISDGQAIVHSGAWWVALFPGLVILVAVFTLNRFSETLGRGIRSR